MTAADVKAACDDLEQALPQAQTLLGEHDTNGAAVHGKPGSRPPWNAEAANALFDALELLVRLKASLHQAVTGHAGQRPAYRQTGATLRDITAFSAAVDEQAQRLTVTLLTRCTTTIEQLPALDKAAKWDRLAVPCPFCQTRWLYAARRSGDVRCAYPDCGMAGRMEMGRFGPQVLWNDGSVWQAA